MRKFPTAGKTGIIPIAMIVAALSFIAVLGFQEDPAEKSAENPWKVDAELSIVTEGNAWVYVLKGTTNLPADTVLKARIFGLAVVDDPRLRGRGKKLDEQPMFYDDDPDAVQSAFRTFNAGDGTFRIEVYRFVREPWSIPYRVRVYYDPDLQGDEVFETVRYRDKTSWFADLPVESSGKYKRQFHERSIEVREDLMEIEALYADFQKTFKAHLTSYDPVAWKKWKKGWYDKIDRLNERNKLRYKMWVLWMERQAGMRVGGMCELLRSMLVDANSELAGEKDYQPVDRERLDGFFAYLEQAIDILGVHIPLPSEKVQPIIAAYERGFDPVREMIRTGKGDWKKLRRPARKACVAAIMKLLPLLENRKRGYAFVNALAEHLRTLVDRIDGDGPEKGVEAALQAHDLALKTFKDFAGVE